MEGTHKVVCMSGPRGRSSDPIGLNLTYLLVLECLPQRLGVAVSHCEDKDSGSRSSGKYYLA